MKYLITNSDDFGMCHAVNRGIVRGFQDGILTQSTLMVPCPWFAEAVALAKTHEIPVGVHLTATCDWDRYRWRPLTPVTSFVMADGTFCSDLRYVRQQADRTELEAEFAAQIECVLAHGIQPTHLDSHMGMVDVDVMGRLCRRYGIPTHEQMVSAQYPDTVFSLSSTVVVYSEYEDKRTRFRQYLEQLTDGYHAAIFHLGEAGDELAAMASREYHMWPWTQPYRASDLAMILDPGVKHWCEELDIHLTTFAACPSPLVKS